MKWRRPWCHPKVDSDEARQALEDARAERERIEARESYIEWLSGRLTDHLEDNHFSEMIMQAMRRKHS